MMLTRTKCSNEPKFNLSEFKLKKFHCSTIAPNEANAYRSLKAFLHTGAYAQCHICTQPFTIKPNFTVQPQCRRPAEQHGASKLYLIAEAVIHNCYSECSLVTQHNIIHGCCVPFLKATYTAILCAI